MSKYHREIKPNIMVDVYDVLLAFRVENPAIQHAIKKMLAPGQRGVKDRITDITEAIISLERAIEIEKEIDANAQCETGQLHIPFE